VNGVSTGVTNITREAEVAIRDVRRIVSDVAAGVDPVLDQAKQGTTAFNENMQALKHNWFFRGFFRDRGYFDPAELTAYETPQLPQTPPARTFVFPSEDLFDEPDTAKLDETRRLKELGRYLEENPPGLLVITSYAGEKGREDDNLKVTRAQAAVVRNYLVENYRIEDRRVITKGFGESAPGEATTPAWRVEILVYHEVEPTFLSNAQIDPQDIDGRKPPR
jgi:outer membrane protein OmpA-like peptidoglycan-associated protein